jgi:hypothetical protein
MGLEITWQYKKSSTTIAFAIIPINSVKNMTFIRHYIWVGDLGFSQNAEWSFALCSLYQEVNLNDEPPTCKWPWNLSLGIYVWYYYTLGTTTLPSYSYSYPTTPPPIIMMQWIFLMNIICPAFVQLWTQSL